MNNYNNVVDYQFALADQIYPGRDVYAFSSTISLRSHKPCHAIKTRIPDQWEWSLNIESGSTLFLLFLL